MIRDLAATVTCTEPDCHTTTNVLLEHLSNVLTPDGWTCWQHQETHTDA